MRAEASASGARAAALTACGAAAAGVEVGLDGRGELGACAHPAGNISMTGKPPVPYCSGTS
jgi:hypothetical protein